MDDVRTRILRHPRLRVDEVDAVCGTHEALHERERCAFTQVHDDARVHHGFVCIGDQVDKLQKTAVLACGDDYPRRLFEQRAVEQGEAIFPFCVRLTG